MEENWRAEGDTCVFKLVVLSLEEESLGEVVKATKLAGRLANGITSVKFSPSCGYVLLGYGVRDNHQRGGDGGNDEGLLHPAVAVYRTSDMQVTTH